MQIFSFNFPHDPFWCLAIGVTLCVMQEIRAEVKKGVFCPRGNFASELQNLHVNSIAALK